MAGTLSAPTPFSPGLVLHALAKNWWLVLLRGLCAIAFGILTFIWPGVSLFSLVLLYGAFALADGVVALMAAVSGNTPAPRWWLAIVGLAGLAAGAVTFLWPGVTVVVLQVFIACWAIVVGVVEIVGAIQLRKEIENEWMLIAAGVVSVLFGILLLAWPGVGLLTLLYAIGSYAIISGVLLIALALRLRSHAHRATA